MDCETSIRLTLATKRGRVFIPTTFVLGGKYKSQTNSPYGDGVRQGGNINLYFDRVPKGAAPLLGAGPDQQIHGWVKRLVETLDSAANRRFHCKSERLPLRASKIILRQETVLVCRGNRSRLGLVGLAA
jgi:hypothetical protein